MICYVVKGVNMEGVSNKAISITKLLYFTVCTHVTYQEVVYF